MSGVDDSLSPDPHMDGERVGPVTIQPSELGKVAQRSRACRSHPSDRMR
jgi:hypothetical protein